MLSPLAGGMLGQLASALRSPYGVVGEAIGWVSVLGCSVTSDRLTKTANTAWGNAGARSNKVLSGDGSVSFTHDAIGQYRIFGFSRSSVEDRSYGYDTIEWGIDITPDRFYIYENGVERVSPVASVGDVATVRKTGTLIEYLQNGAVFYTSTIPCTSEVFVDAAIYTASASLYNGLLNGAWVPMRTGLMYEWLLEEASGNRIDTKVGKVLIPSVAMSDAAGKVGRAVNIGALRTNRLTTSFGWSTTDISVSVWVNANGLGTGASGQNYIFNRGGGNGGFWILYWGNSGVNKFACYAASSSNGTAQWPISPTTGQWYHICCGYRNSDTRCWISVNGGAKFLPAVLLSNPQTNAIANVQVGNEPTGNYGWDGLIDQLRVYDYELTDSDIAALYNGGNGI